MNTSSEAVSEGLLVGLGNPLLDISAVVGEDLLKKYGLQPNDAIMADEQHMPLYKELTEKYDAEFIAGGSVQNSLRVAQWILKKPNVCTYFGCVGNDDYAKTLRDKAVADGVKVLYQVSEQAATGTCAVLVTGTNRSLCANLAAAQKFTVDHLAKPESKKAIESAKFFYSSGFFVAVSPESMMQLAKHANDNNLTFSLNLSAPFVSQFYKEPLEKLIPYVDVLFGNEAEAIAFAKSFNLKSESLQEIAIEISKMPKANANRARVVVITQSALPVLLVQDGAVDAVPVDELPSQLIVDTNGAGDAFTGGFLSQMVLGKPYKQCVECGIYSARHVIQHSGCTFTGVNDYKPDL